MYGVSICGAVITLLEGTIFLVTAVTGRLRRILLGDDDDDIDGAAAVGIGNTFIADETEVARVTGMPLVTSLGITGTTDGD